MGPLRGLAQRLRTEAGAAGLLALVTLAALLWANTPLSGAYDALWHVPAGFSIGPVGLTMDLHHWVNDGLMVLFFFLVGLEVRHELAEGSLRDRGAALLPMAAGVAGVVLPVLIYLAVVREGEGLAGWGVVVGTDTAFLLGALAVIGPSMSNQLRVFLLALTVVDDFLAVAVLGLFYSDDAQPMWLLPAVACLGALWLLGRTRQWRSSPYVAVVAVLWFATVQAGVHPSLAGMVAGLLVPAYATQRRSVELAKSDFRDYWQSPQAVAAQAVRSSLSRSISVNARLQQSLRGPTTLLIVPVFALANAGVDLRGGLLGDALASSVTWGVVLGLVVGKLAGISLVTLAAVRLGLGRLPVGVGGGSVLGGAALSGIGFTVSLLVVELAFDGSALAGQATVGVLVAMVLALLLGWAVFAVAARVMGETSADLPVVLDPAVDHERDHVRGRPDAPLTVVEYFDFECPFCARATGMWRDLKERFGEDLRYVVRHVPLDGMHPHARRAAAAAEAAARQGRFWEMHDLLFSRQDDLGEDALLACAAELGLDVDAFAADLASPDVAALVQEHADSAWRSGVRGTPTFFVDGIRHLGPHDARTLIDRLEAVAR